MNRISISIWLLLVLTLGQGCGVLPSLFRAPAQEGADQPGGDSASSLVFDPELLGCGLANCTIPAVLCVFDTACREALVCHARCGSRGVRSEQQACHLACQLGQGEQDQLYSAMIQCFADNGCLPKLPEGTDGRCVVTSENIDNVYVLQDLDEIEGTWREVRGLNCGFPGSNWEGGYDALPCRSSSWVFRAEQWWYHTAFCAPTADGACSAQEVVHLIAEPRTSDEQPGLLEVPYINPPLQPQDESWYVLSRPHPDWVMYTYCGSTPVGAYAGVNIMTRAAEPSDAAMPPEAEAAFRQTAADFNFNYDDMCVTDHSQCPPVTAEEDVQAWINGL